MYIENAQNGKPQLWKYLIGFIVVMIAWQVVGSIPIIAVSLLVTTEWSALQTNALYVSTAEPNLNHMLISLGGMFVVLLSIFGVRYRWNNWSEKLFGKIEPQSFAEST